MKPTGVLIERYIDVESEQETGRASIVMSPDTPNGFFFGLATGDRRLEVPVTVKDAERFQKSKSETVKQKILDTYVIPVPDTQKFNFTYGAVLGNVTVGSVLEVPGEVIQEAPKRTRK